MCACIYEIQVVCMCVRVCMCVGVGVGVGVSVGVGVGVCVCVSVCVGGGEYGWVDGWVRMRACVCEREQARTPDKAWQQWRGP